MKAENEKIWLSSPHMSEEGYEMEYIKEAFESNWIAPLGPNVNEFENEFAEKVGSEHAAALTSGTHAIHMALKACGVGEEDIVFCPTFTFSATVNPILYEGAKPVFVDSDKKTWNMDPDLLEEAFKKYPNVKAVLIVHLYGLSADMDRIMEICKTYNVPVIEDAAESLGGFYKGQQTGTIGDIGIYSFNGNKIITTSGGGMLVSDNKKIVEKVRFWSTQSRDKARHYQHSEIGYNYRMSNVVAGVGRGQLKILEQRVEQKKYIYNYYKEHFSDLEGIEFMPKNDWDDPNYWLSCLVLDSQERQQAIINALDEKNIESRPLWKPMHLQPIFEKYDVIDNHVASELFKVGLCLPSDTKTTDEDLNRVVNVIKETVGE